MHSQTAAATRCAARHSPGSSPPSSHACMPTACLLHLRVWSLALSKSQKLITAQTTRLGTVELPLPRCELLHAGWGQTATRPFPSRCHSRALLTTAKYQESRQRRQLLPVGCALRLLQRTPACLSQANQPHTQARLNHPRALCRRYGTATTPRTAAAPPFLHPQKHTIICCTDNAGHAHYRTGSDHAHCGEQHAHHGEPIPSLQSSTAAAR